MHSCFCLPCSVSNRAPWRNFFRDFFATFTSDPYVPNDQWKAIPGPSERPRGETPAGSGTVTPTPETTEAALAKSSTSAASTSATGERDIDPSNPARSVPKKKANSPFLVHQKWKEEQELRRRKAAEQDSSRSGSTGGGSRRQQRSNEESTIDFSGPAKLLVKLVRYLVLAVAVVMAAGFFVAGDALWGYRGKYTRLRTYMPVSKDHRRERGSTLRTFESLIVVPF